MTLYHFQKNIIFVSIGNDTPEFLKDVQEYALQSDLAVKCSLDNLMDKLNSIERFIKNINSKKQFDFINSCFGFENETDLLKLIYWNNN